MAIPLTSSYLLIMSEKHTSAQYLCKCTVPMTWQANTREKCQSILPVVGTQL